MPKELGRAFNNDVKKRRRMFGNKSKCESTASTARTKLYYILPI